MRKKCVWIILVAVLGFALIAGILFFPRHKDKIALTEGLRFGMVPLEVRMHYGAPDEQETSAASSEILSIYFTTLYLCGDVTFTPRMSSARTPLIAAPSISGFTSNAVYIAS